MKRLIFINLFGFIFLFALNAQARPDWVNRPYSVFPERLYVAAVGAGKDSTAAAINAKNELAAYFRQSIKSRIEVIDREQNRNGRSVYNSDILSKIEATVENATLLGAEVKESWDDTRGKTGSWAVAVIEKAKGRELYDRELTKNINEINRLFGNNVEISFKTLAVTRTVQEYLAQAETNAFMLRMLDGAERQQELSQFAVIMDKMTQDIKAIPFDIKVTGDEGGRLKDAFAKAFKDIGISASGKEPEFLLKVVFSRSTAPKGVNYNTNFTVNAVLKNMQSGEALFSPYIINDKAGHRSSQEQADSRAIINAAIKITKEFPMFLQKNLSF
jgi:hypothetical protein